MKDDAEKIKEFCIALKRGPTFLFLGQDYLRLESGIDPFLSEVLRKYGKTSNGLLQYSQIFEGDAQSSIDSALAWMQELCSRLSIPQWLKTVASYSWSGIYSSAIDVIWPNAFRSDWRELQHLFEEKYKPIDPRNRLKLHCTYLFGNVSRTEETERPPLTEIELLNRNQIAITLARRLPEIITPFGVLIIEGYAGERDWFSPKDLLPIIDNLNPNQTHIFSVTEELEKNRYIVHLVSKNKLILHSESLAIYLLKGQESGFLQLGRRPDEEEHGRRIQLEEKILTVPSNIWNQVSMSAMILDDSILITPPPLSDEKRYSEFRNFLSESSTRPIWSGYERGFAFHRDFETKLHMEVEKRLKSKELQNEPVILHGQTGTGKTVALGALAYKIRKERKHPVLFIERKSQRVLNSDIDYFCKWAEDSVKQTTLIIWDGMLDIDQYYDLLRYLVGRGRKVVLVGSCYRLDTKKHQRENYIEAPANLNKSEISNFSTFINSLDSSLVQLLKEPIKLHDDTFLVALYRLLPPTRGLIRSGVQREAGLAELEIYRKAQVKTQEFPSNTLGYAFYKAGLITKETLLSSEDKEIGGERVNDIQELMGLVIVPGRFGLKIPLDLLLRAWGKKGFLNLSNLLEEIDIFRIHEDTAGNIFVGPRHPLEAKLLAQVRLGGAKAEAAFVKQLILEIKENYDALDNPEVQLAVNLIQSIGPNGQDTGHFVSYYRELSDTLKKVREERGIQNPRLMLQEATLLREYVVEKSKYGGSPPADAAEILNEAEKILERTLKLLKDDRKNNKMRSIILLELATTLGSRATHLLNHTNRPQDSIPLFQEARKNLFKARDLDSNSYYPLDVLAWTTRDILKTDILDLQTRAEAIADILYAFEMAEAQEFGVDEQESFHMRRMEIASILGKQDLSEDAFKSLLAKGSCAGYYLKAYEIIRDLPKNTELTPFQRALCRPAVKYLEDNRKALARDSRCLYLLLHTWWKIHTGKPIFYGERQAVPFSQEDWQYFLGIITDLMSIGELSAKPSLIYLQGLATFHLNFTDDALRIFQRLERESDYVTGRRRIIRSYIASTPDGQPKKYNGTVAWVSEDGSKGEVYVDGLRRNIRFLPRDFNKPDIQKHETLNEFHLAFNFIGLIADPVGYLKPL